MENKSYLEDFGGRLDDPNFDNRPVLVRAIDYLSRNGGGILTTKGRGYVHLNGVIDLEEVVTGPSQVIVQFMSFYNIDTTTYSTEYEKRDKEIKSLLDDLLESYIKEIYKSHIRKYSEIDDINSLLLEDLLYDLQELTNEIDTFKDEAGRLLG